MESATRREPIRVADARAAVEAVPLWYHTLEVAPGVVTPGWFDLRSIVDRMPWPDVRGKRCLDVGTYDGFLAFELERRGASEVVATDIASHEEWDWPPHLAERGTAYLREAAGEKGAGFRVAKEVLGSSVERVAVNVYDLDPQVIGQFDVVVCGSLLLHLRDPLRALAAIREVCRGHFMSAESISLPLTLLLPGRPVLRLDGVSDLCIWTFPNAAGHRQIVEATGFELERTPRPFTLPFGPAHPSRRPSQPRAVAGAVARRVLTGANGVINNAVLAKVSPARR